MTTKLKTLTLLLLAACSGSTAGVELTEAVPDAPGKPAPTQTEDSTPPATIIAEEAGPQADASDDASLDSGVTQDSSSDAGQDASDDASQPDSGPDAGVDAAPDASPPVARFGLTFGGQNDTGAYSPLPPSMSDQASLTLEAYFRLNAVTDRGLIFYTAYAACGVQTSGPDINSIFCCDSVGDTHTCVVGAVKATLGVWRHVAWSLSSGNWALYVDGQKQGDVPSLYQTYPTVGSMAQPNKYTYVFFGMESLINNHAVVGTLDEFRVKLTAYTADFAPAKHLDTPGALNLMLDEGVGTTSGTATFFGATAWSTVSR